MKKNIFIISIFLVTMFFCGVEKVWAENHYVDCSQGSNGLGTTEASPWNSIDSVNNHPMGESDDVYFKRGSECHNQQLNIDWSGTASNPVIIGAYGSGNKPIISGTDKTRTTVNTFPANEWDPLINSSQNSYLTIQDLNVKNSGGRGISVGGESFGSLASNIIIQRCTLSGFYRQGVWTRYLNNLSFIENDVSDGSYNDDAPVVNFLSSINGSFKNNYIHDTNFEGIYIQDSRDVIIEENEFDNVRTRSITLLRANDSDLTKNITIRKNLIYGGDASRYSDSGYYGVNTGISINDGSRYSVNHVYIYGNFISDVTKGVYFCTGSARPFEGPTEYIYVYNNTIVDCDTSFYWGTLGVANNVEIKNNIIAQYSSELDYTGGRVNWTGFAGGYNIWYGGVSLLPTALSESHNIFSNPKLFKESDWRNGTVPTVNDFKLQLTSLVISPAINKGVNLGSPYNVDYFGTSRPQDGFWDIGAHEYVGSTTPSDTTPPSNPTGLSVS